MLEQKKEENTQNIGGHQKTTPKSPTDILHERQRQQAMEEIAFCPDILLEDMLNIQPCINLKTSSTEKPNLADGSDNEPCPEINAQLYISGKPKEPEKRIYYKTLIKDKELVQKTDNTKTDNTKPNKNHFCTFFLQSPPCQEKEEDDDDDAKSCFEYPIFQITEKPELTLPDKKPSGKKGPSKKGPGSSRTSTCSNSSTSLFSPAIQDQRRKKPELTLPDKKPSGKKGSSKKGPSIGNAEMICGKGYPAPQKQKQYRKTR